MLYIPEKYTHNPRIFIRFMEKVIKRTKTIKILGLTIDKNLSWLPHVDKLKTKIAVVSNRLKALRCKDWGLNPKALKRIYIHRGVERMFIYAAGAQCLSGGAKSLRAKLRHIQRPILLVLTGGYRNSPTAALQVLAGIQPLELKLDYEKDWYDYSK